MRLEDHSEPKLICEGRKQNIFVYGHYVTVYAKNYLRGHDLEAKLLKRGADVWGDAGLPEDGSFSTKRETGRAPPGLPGAG